MPNKMTVYHVKWHQHNNSHIVDLSISAKLNIVTDKLIGKKFIAPLMANIKNTPTAVYVNDKYIPNNYVSAIRNYCAETEARNFTKTKYDWSPKVILNIQWKLLDSYIRNKSYSTKKTIKQFIHNWLASGKKNYGQPLLWPYCKQPETHPCLTITSSLAPNRPLERKIY